MILASFGGVVLELLLGLAVAPLWLMEGVLVAIGASAVGFLVLSIWVGWVEGRAQAREDGQTD